MTSRRAIKHYLLLLAFALLTLLLLTGINRFSSSLFPVENILLLTGGFTFIAVISLMIFFYGSEGNEEKSVFATMIALGVKMLLSFVMALLFFVVLKNKGTGSVILFFILYLSFTVFVILAFLRIIRRKSV